MHEAALLRQNVEEVIREIRERAKREADEILAKAKAEAERILSEARARADEIALRQALSQLTAMRRILVGESETRVRRRLLEVKQRIVRRLRELVEERVRRVLSGEDPEIKYDEALYRFIKQAAVKIGETELIVLCNERDRKLLESRLREFEHRLSRELGVNVRLSLGETINCEGGLVVRNRRGDKVFHSTVEGRVSEVFDRYVKRLNRLLLQA